MKTTAIVIFLTIVIAIFALVNSYIYARTAPIFAGSFYRSISLKLVFWLVVFSYPLGRVLERVIGSGFTTFLIKVGSFWLGAMLYLILLFLLVDIARSFNHFFHFTPYLSFKTNPESRLIIIKSVYIITALLLIVGFINARIPKINHFNLNIGKSFGKHEKVRVVAVSDIHLGTLIAKNRLNNLVEKINDQNPDIVLFAGDVFDEDIAPVVNNGLGKYFEKIKAPLGIYAVPGNHEFFGNIEQKLSYLRSHGVNVLVDSTALVDSSFYIIGRNDRQANHTLTKRKEISELCSTIDKSKPLILLDHQPFNLNESAENKIDLQISGHTHYGQLWPFGYITDAVFELSWGYKKIGDTHFIVSTGYGTWGPPVRLGNRPEILVIDIRQ